MTAHDHHPGVQLVGHGLGQSRDLGGDRVLQATLPAGGQAAGHAGAFPAAHSRGLRGVVVGDEQAALVQK
ncbi:hypothetical protein ACH427_28105 [Streptomyces sp. NPDC020379]|uniref:hypothetical protein n=1 Tax=Streptomyces sp. NPDC020379 TaxID=3365071 RepID=UPI0037BC0569